jgi:hypothetical protein
MSHVIEALQRRGIVIPCPSAIEVGEDVNPERIAPGVVLHAGCRVLGAETSIGPGSELGAEAPVTLENCQLGSKVALRGGYFSGATFLDAASMGSGAHVRSGTLLEEEASGAHTVGLKQTLFLSFVTAGSLINFCDALMAGGSSRKNHSEIGSSYIHFNFTPHQDKATPSLLGDVPSGVMLDQEPIFLGGQGGLVGPARIAFGTVIPAGVICRNDVLEENLCYVPPAAAPRTRTFRVGAYRHIGRIVVNNLTYIGNIHALKLWYELVRRSRMTADPFSEACHSGALRRLDEVLDERTKRLRDLAGKMERSLEYATKDHGLAVKPEHRAQQEALRDRWPELEVILGNGPPADAGARQRDAFLTAWAELGQAGSHLEAMRALPPTAKSLGTAWLRAIVASFSGLFEAV